MPSGSTVIKISNKKPETSAEKHISQPDTQVPMTDLNTSETSQKRQRDTLTYANRGFSYLRKDQFDKAIADYNRAVEVNPGFAVAYYNRGTAYYKVGQFYMATSDYKKAIELNPEYGETNDDQEIECRRVRALTGALIKQEYCATKTQWAAGDIKKRKTPGINKESQDIWYQNIFIYE